MRVICFAWIALAVVAPLATAAPVPFGPPRIVSNVTLGARAVVAGDIDLDGDLDLISASSTDDSIGWHRNDGDGNFSIGQLMSNTFTGARSVALGDLDGDGDLDAVGAARSLSALAWFENLDGLGAYSSEVLIDNGFSGVRTVALADVDGDGDLDLVAGGDTANLISWYENLDGAGLFGIPQLITTRALFVQEIFVSDVDDDGDVDVLSASAIDNKIAWYENADGAGTFGPQQILANDALDARSISTADLDGDGDEDIVATSQDDDTVAWFENLGGGTFGPKLLISTLEDEPQSVVTADVDRDGDIDVLTILDMGDAVVWYENLGGVGSFAPAAIVTSAIDGGESMIVADLDGDGDPDVVSASTNDARIAWYENGTLRSSAAFPAGSLVSSDALGVERIRIADLDGDGDEDLVAALAGSEAIVWYENDGLGSFAAEQPVAVGFVGARDLNVGDVDRDGDLDVVASAGANMRVSWFENLGDAMFGPERLVDASAVDAEEVDLGDLDGDGDLDLLVASMGDDTIAWFDNQDGAGGFGPRQVLSDFAPGARSLEASDLDGDGDADVVYAASAGDLLAWHENLGGGTFGPRQVIDNIVFGPFSIDAEDLDGDGDLDLAVVASRGGDVGWYQNNDGVWVRHLIDPSFENPADIQAVDVDRDGDLDIVAAAAGSGAVAWYENQAEGSGFGPPIILTAQAPGAKTVAGADLDGDGDIDVAAGAMGVDTVRWFSNCGGQLALETADSAPLQLLESGRDDVLKIDVEHLGMAGDPPIRLERIRLLFEESPGVPMTGAQATDLFESLSIFRDDGSGLFERLNDRQLTMVTEIGLVAGQITIDLPPSVFTDVVVGAPAVYYVVVELRDDAAEKDPGSFFVTHVVRGAEGTRASYRIDIPAIVQCPVDVRSDEVLTGSLQLSISGPCPGQTAIAISGGNANDRVGLASGRAIGIARIPAGECAETEIQLDDPSLFRVMTLDADGNAFLPFDASQAVCGGFLQAVDLQNCARSNVDVVGLHAPVAEDIVVTAEEDTAEPIMLLATDVDDDPLTFSIVDPPANGQLQGTPPAVVYLADENYFGGDSFTYIANDGQFDSELATVTITVNPVNDAPIAFEDTVNTNENVPIEIALVAIDIEDDPLSYEIIDLPANGLLSGVPPDVTYTPDPGFFGSDSFTFRVDDGELDSNLALISIGVAEVNSAPIAQDGAAVTDEDVPTAITLLASDPDMDPLTWQITDNPADGTISGTPPLVTYTPNGNFNGSDSFAFQVNDGQLDSNIATVTLTVNPVNDAPVADDQAVQTERDTPLPITLTASDVEDDPLTFTLADSPKNGQVIGTPPDVTYSPDPGYVGPDGFRFTANDGELNSNVATISIAVTPGNQAPIADDQVLSTPEDTDLTITLTAADPELDLLTYAIVDGPVEGALSGMPPDLTYSPGQDFNGVDTFTFTAADDELTSEVAAVTIAVDPVNDDPVLPGQALTTSVNQALTVTISAEDVDGDVLTFGIDQIPVFGTLSAITQLPPSGAEVVYTPDLDFVGADSFVVLVDDGAGGTDAATVDVEVTP